METLVAEVSAADSLAFSLPILAFSCFFFSALVLSLRALRFRARAAAALRVVDARADGGGGAVVEDGGCFFSGAASGADLSPVRPTRLVGRAVFSLIGRVARVALRA